MGHQLGMDHASAFGKSDDADRFAVDDKLRMSGLGPGVRGHDGAREGGCMFSGVAQRGPSCGQCCDQFFHRHGYANDPRRGRENGCRSAAEYLCCGGAALFARGDASFARGTVCIARVDHDGVEGTASVEVFAVHDKRCGHDAIAGKQCGGGGAIGCGGYCDVRFAAGFDASRNGGP